MKFTRAILVSNLQEFIEEVIETINKLLNSSPNQQSKENTSGKVISMNIPPMMVNRFLITLYSIS